MRKIAFIIFACFAFICMQAQEKEEHLKFMGIELNGTIAEFQNKLLAKGLTVSPESKLQPTGVRVFDGAFSGNDAQIVVWYNPRSKEVYRAKAILYTYGKDLVEQMMKKMEIKLDAKYGTKSKYSEVVKDDFLHEFMQHEYNVENGTIGLFIVSTGYSAQNKFYLHIDYKDWFNYIKNTQDEMDDL